MEGKIFQELNSFSVFHPIGKLFHMVDDLFLMSLILSLRTDHHLVGMWIRGSHLLMFPLGNLKGLQGTMSGFACRKT